jgi:hypothetical protein
MRISAILSSTLLVAWLGLVVPQQADAIGGGEPDGNGHPNVGVIGFDLDGPDGALPPFALCTAFLVSDSVAVTAAHCIAVAPGASWAVTLEPGSPGAPVVLPGIFPDDFPFPILAPATHAEAVTMHPRFGEGHPQANDVAVLQFPEGTFADVTPVALPGERELDMRAARGGLLGQEFTLVGYGTVPIDRTTGQRIVEGFRQVASAPYQGLTPESLVLQATPEATDAGFVCSGDSGGPQFLGASNLAVSLVGGITDRGSPCGTGARFLQRLDTPVIRDFLSDHIDLP